MKTEEEIIKELTIKHFESQGFECATELRGFGGRQPDIIAWSKLTNTIYAIECKGSGFTSLFQAIGQALPYKAMAHEVFVSVPDKTISDPSFDEIFVQNQCDKTCISILFFILDTGELSKRIESSSKNTEFQGELLEKLRKKFQTSYWAYDVFDEHPEYYREVVRIIESLGGFGTTEQILERFKALKGTEHFLQKYPNMRKTGGFKIKELSSMDAIMRSSKTLGLVTEERGCWKLTPIAQLLLKYINKNEGDILNKEEEIIFQILAFNPTLSKEVYDIVRMNPDITKKDLANNLGKVLPRYGISHDPEWFVDRLALFLSNCRILEKKRIKQRNVYRTRI